MAKKKQSFKDLCYILWEYYRWLILVITILIIFLTTFIGIQLTKKTDAFSAFVINGYQHNQSDELISRFADFAQIDTNKSQISIECILIGEDNQADSYAVAQTIAALAASARLDTVIMDTTLFSAYAHEGIFFNLEDCLTSEQIDALSGKLYYVEKEQGQGLQSHGDLIISKDPNNFSSPIPIGIDISDSKRFSDTFLYPNNDFCLGIVSSSNHIDNSVKFIEYLLLE